MECARLFDEHVGRSYELVHASMLGEETGDTQGRWWWKRSKLFTDQLCCDLSVTDQDLAQLSLDDFSQRYLQPVMQSIIERLNDARNRFTKIGTLPLPVGVESAARSGGVRVIRDFNWLVDPPRYILRIDVLVG